jgi:hypothetical protein
MSVASCVCGWLQVGFFLHTPFPSSEIYRTLPVREELLRAVLKADLIGFHTGGRAGGRVGRCLPACLPGGEVGGTPPPPPVCASLCSCEEADAWALPPPPSSCWEAGRFWHGNTVPCLHPRVSRQQRGHKQLTSSLSVHQNWLAPARHTQTQAATPRHPTYYPAARAGVEDNGSLTRVAAFPIGIDPDRFTSALETPEVKANIAQLLNRCVCGCGCGCG